MIISGNTHAPLDSGYCFTITAIGPVAAQTTRELAYQLAETSIDELLSRCSNLDWTAPSTTSNAMLRRW